MPNRTVRTFDISIPEMAFVAGTRGMVGLGIGLLVADYLKTDTRRTIGWTLLSIGALTTLPIAATVIGRTRQRMLAD